MDIDETLHRAACQLNASLSRGQIPDPPRQSSRAVMAVVLSVAVVIVVLGGFAFVARYTTPTVVTGSATPARSTTPTLTPAGGDVEFSSQDHGFVITYPENWYRADDTLAPALTSPPQQIEEVLSLGTYPLRPGGAECPHVPLNALLDLGSEDVLVSIVLGNSETGNPWPTAFKSSSFLPDDPPIDARTCSGRFDVEFQHGVFTLDGRQIQVLVAFGDAIDDETRNRTWRVLDSFRWTATVSTATTTTTTATTTTQPPTAEPATGPLFGNPSDVVLLFDDGIDGVLALDPDTRVGSRSVLEGQRAGDQPYRLTRVEDSLVVGWSSIHASDVHTGKSTQLGDATIYVPAAETDRIWLIRWAGDRIGAGLANAWQVDTSGQQLTEPAELDVEGFPAIGIPGGLAMQTDDGIWMWYPDGAADGAAFGDASATILDVSGNQLAFCEDGSCVEAQIIDQQTGRLQTIYRDEGFGHAARFSPDGTHLALVTRDGTVVLASTQTGAAVDIIDDLTTDVPLHVDWSPDGTQLFAATYSHGQPQMMLARYDIETGDLDTARVPFGGAFSFVVLTSDEGATFLSDGDQPSDACPPVSVMPSGREGICGFRF